MEWTNSPMVRFQLSGFLGCNRAKSPVGSAMGDFTDCAMMELCR